jgi:hypothetical protein
MDASADPTAHPAFRGWRDIQRNQRMPGDQPGRVHRQGRTVGDAPAMIWWSGKMIAMLRSLASELIIDQGRGQRKRYRSGREIAWHLNVAFGTFLTADAVRRQAAVQGIKLRGRSGPPKGNRNANANSWRGTTRDPHTGRILSGRLVGELGEADQNHQRIITALPRPGGGLVSQSSGDRGEISLAMPDDGS